MSEQTDIYVRMGEAEAAAVRRYCDSCRASAATPDIGSLAHGYAVIPTKTGFDGLISREKWERDCGGAYAEYRKVADARTAFEVQWDKDTLNTRSRSSGIFGDGV